MDRTAYLPTHYTENDKKLIKIFQEEMKRLDVLYARAIVSWDIKKAKNIIAKIKKIARRLEVEYSSRADNEIPRNYLLWWMYVNNLMGEDDDLKIILNADWKDLMEKIKWLWPIHIDAVYALLDTSKNYVKSSLDWMERQALTMVWQLEQEKVRETLARWIVSWDSLQDMKEKVTKYFYKNKITWFKDRSWRLWSMERYVDMLVRTETSIANVQGTINRAIQLWLTKFKVVEHSDCCEYCATENWKVVDIRNWTVDLPPYHPNCRGYIIVVIE